MKNEKIITIILSWNELELTKRCIKTILNQSIKTDILVIDNNSKKNPVSILKYEFPSINIIRNSKNLGVAGGRNIGVNYALEKGYNFVLFIDNDAFADRNLIYYFLEAEKKYKKAGIFGPKILKDDNMNVIWRAGCKSWKWVYLHSGSEILKRLFTFSGKIPFFLDYYRGVNQKDIEQFDRDEIIDFQIGCVQFIRRETFTDIGLLDEEYSPYGSEDIDFCERAQKFGWKIFYVHKAKCWHRDSGSMGDSYLKTYYNHKNILLLARKNLSFFHFFFFFLPDYFVVILPLTIIDNLFHKKPFKLKAIYDALKWNIKDCMKRNILINKKMI